MTLGVAYIMLGVVVYNVEVWFLILYFYLLMAVEKESFLFVMANFFSKK